MRRIGSARGILKNGEATETPVHCSFSNPSLSFFPADTNGTYHRHTSIDCCERAPLIATPRGLDTNFGSRYFRMKSKAPGIDCESLAFVSAMRAISGKWKIQIICLLLGGTKRFGELRRSLTGVHRGTLTYELRGLEADGIVQRTQYMTIPPTVEYKLTARGTALKPVIIALSRWIQTVNETRPASPSERK